MSFSWATSYLLGTINETMSRREPYRLERMVRFLEALGNPQEAYPTLHVGGTSGKGSTSTMLAAALTASGRKCGLHTKPHLVSMTERIVIDGKPIHEDAFADLLVEMMPAIDKTTAALNRPSYYETLLAMAFLAFKYDEVDVAVIEVGIGGRLDGTNVLRPRVSVITNVGLDHREILGDTIEAIASDKAGIAKPGVPLVTDATEPARGVIEEAAREALAPFVSVRDAATVEAHDMRPEGQRFDVVTRRDRYAISTTALGAFQRRNAATAIVALETLSDDLRPERDRIEEGFARIVMPGRMEYLGTKPGVVLDIAHNPDKMRGLAESLRLLFPDRRLHFVVAIGEDKEAREMLEPLLSLPASFLFTTFEAPGRKAMRPARLASFASESGHWVRAIADPVEAFNVARRGASADDVVVVTGSTVIVGTVRAWWLKNMQAAGV